MRSVVMALLMAALICSAPAIACEWAGPFIPKLPNENEADQDGRMSEAFRKEGVLRDYRHQKQAFAEASAVFLGEITDAAQSEPVPDVTQATVEIKPLQAFKGTLPSQTIRLKSTNSSGLCYPMGDGEASFASKGDLVVVFTGLKKIKDFRPNGIDSMDIRWPLAEEIIQGLEKYGIEDLN